MAPFATWSGPAGFGSSCVCSLSSRLEQWSRCEFPQTGSECRDQMPVSALPCRHQDLAPALSPLTIQGDEHHQVPPGSAPHSTATLPNCPTQLPTHEPSQQIQGHSSGAPPGRPMCKRWSSIQGPGREGLCSHKLHIKLLLSTLTNEETEAERAEISLKLQNQ